MYADLPAAIANQRQAEFAAAAAERRLALQLWQDQRARRQAAAPRRGHFARRPLAAIHGWLLAGQM